MQTNACFYSEYKSAINKPQNVKQSEIKSRYVWKWRVGQTRSVTGTTNNGEERQSKRQGTWTEEIALTGRSEVRTTKKVSFLQKKKKQKRLLENVKLPHHRSQQGRGPWLLDNTVVIRKLEACSVKYDRRKLPTLRLLKFS